MSQAITQPYSSLSSIFYQCQNKLEKEVKLWWIKIETFFPFHVLLHYCGRLEPMLTRRRHNSLRLCSEYSWMSKYSRTNVFPGWNRGRYDSPWSGVCPVKLEWESWSARVNQPSQLLTPAHLRDGTKSSSHSLQGLSSSHWRVALSA